METKRINLVLLIALIIPLSLFFYACDDDDAEPEIEITIGSVTDIDGNLYKTVKINDVEWMAENLKTTKYRNGSPISYPGNDNIAWNEMTTGAYAWYNNNSSDWKGPYGALYNAHAVQSGSGLCPSGWRMPTKNDIEELVELLGGASIAGGKLKSEKTTPEAHPRWNAPNTDATNEVSWAGLPGGLRYPNGHFNYLGLRGNFWTSTTHDPYPDQAYFFSLEHDSAIYGVSPTYKTAGFSVRCIK